MVKGKVQPVKGTARKNATVSQRSTPTSTPAHAEGKSNGHKKSLCVPSCMSCGSVISDEVKALQCDRCQSNEKWKCAECMNLTPEMYDHLVSDPGCSLRWFCNECDKTVMDACDQAGMDARTVQPQNEKLDSLITLVERLMQKYENFENKLVDKCTTADLTRLSDKLGLLEERLSKLDRDIEVKSQTTESRIQELEKWSGKHDKEFDVKLADIEDKVTSKCDRIMASNPSGANVSGSEGLIKLVVQDELNKKTEEEQDMEKRKRNIIIYRVPEKKCDNVKDRREVDVTFVKDLLDGVFNTELHDGDIEKIYRLGHWTEDKARPLLVGFKDYETKETVMANLRNFKDTPVAKFQQISISHDLPPKEREDIKNMIQLAKREHSEENEDSAENYWFRVVGRGSRKKVIKVRK